MCHLIFISSHVSSKVARNYDITIRCFQLLFFPLQGKQVIRPIAFRPVPGVGGNSGASTPTNGNVFGLFRPMGGGGGGTAPSSGQTTPASMLQPYSDVQPSPAPPPFTSHVTLGGGVVPGGPGGHPPHLLQLPKPNEGFAPGHPLVKDGRRHYGSKFYKRRLTLFCSKHTRNNIYPLQTPNFPNISINNVLKDLF